jgi:hypothetical protein
VEIGGNGLIVREAGIPLLFPRAPSGGTGKSRGITILKGLFTPQIAVLGPQRATFTGIRLEDGDYVTSGPLFWYIQQRFPM